MNLKNVTTTYDFTLLDMQSLIAEKLEKKLHQVSVSYVISEVGADPLDRFPGTKQVTGIRVTVKDQ